MTCSAIASRSPLTGQFEGRNLARAVAMIDWRVVGPHYVALTALTTTNCASPPCDAGPVVDAGLDLDAGFGPDTGSPDDGGFADGAAGSLDAGQARDAGPDNLDSGPDLDANGPANADAEPADAQPTDAGPALDAAPQLDAGSAPAPTALSLTHSGAAITFGFCHPSALQVGLRDGADQPIVAPNDVTVQLGPHPTAAVGLFSDNRCRNAITNVVVPAGQSTADVYLEGLREGPSTLQATSSGLTRASAAMTVETCAGGCGTCGGSGVCCSPSTCRAGRACSPTCDSGCGCQLDCASADDCTARCTDGASCQIDCTGANNCEAVCNGGSECVVECDGANNCDDLRCTNGAQCLVFCGTANNCAWDSCSGGRTSCPGNVIACNRPCP